MSIWVRILNLPFEWMNEKKGRKIAGVIDKNCSVDVDEFGVASGTFLRARVAIPFDQPLRRWVTIRRDGRDECFQLQYEKLPFFCFGCGLIGHGELECKTPADRDAQGRLPFDRNLRAPEERRRKPQSFEQAAASASWNSSNKKSGLSSATSRTSGDVDPKKSAAHEVSSPPPKVSSGNDNSKISELARRLFPGENSQIQLLKKRKPGEGRDGPPLSAPEGGMIEKIDKDLSLAIVPAGLPMELVTERNNAVSDTGQGNEKKPRCETVDNNLCPRMGTKTDAGLPFQPCRDQ
jgi:hypothetical protein